MERDHGPLAECAASFHTTRWTIVMGAAQSQALRAQSAFAQFCRNYWYPLCMFSRHLKRRGRRALRHLVTVSVAHEALLREWQRVKEWLTENREFLRMRDRLDSSVKLWLSRGKQKDDLLGPGLPLAEGEKLVKDFGPSLNQEQTDFVYASINERKRRKHAEGGLSSRIWQEQFAMILVIRSPPSLWSN